MKQARLFIVLDMVHFVIGVTLGGTMAVDTSLWGTLIPVHAELNPFGWLTILIYGMTYAVLASFGRFRPLSAAAGWTHLLCAEIGVAAIALGAGFSLNVLVEAGWVFQALAPLLFLRNIMWIVRSRQSVAERSTGADSESAQDGSSASGLLTPAVYAESTDRIAQRGTSLALLCWIIAAVWMAADVLATAGADAANLPMGAAIAAVAPDPGSAAGRLGFALIGAALIWIAILYVWQMRRDWFKRLGVTSGVACQLVFRAGAGSAARMGSRSAVARFTASAVSGLDYDARLWRGLFAVSPRVAPLCALWLGFAHTNGGVHQRGCTDADRVLFDGARTGRRIECTGCRRGVCRSRRTLVHRDLVRFIASRH